MFTTTFFTTHLKAPIGIRGADESASEARMFGQAKSVFKMTEAALVVQQVLRASILVGAPPFDPAALSRKLVAEVWQQKPELFDGKIGKRPHKVSVAAIALAQGLNDNADNFEIQSIILLALGAVLLDVNNNGRLYDLVGADKLLLEVADKAYVATEQRHEVLIRF